jgi:RNA polymerase sigma-70 factor (ECF subfamily)
MNPKDYAAALARIVRSGASWNLSEDAVREVLQRSVASWGGIERGEPVAEYFDSIRTDDLALAIACRNGVTSAWEKFVVEYRPILYAAARAIARDEMAAREIADSLWADLYGTDLREGKRRSLLDYFHGRSSLATWLRAIVAQRHIDAIRAGARFDSLDKAPELTATDNSRDPGHSEIMRIFSMVLAAAVAALPSQDRMRLRLYYVEELKLRDIARVTDEHESTISRKLDRVRTQLRKQVETALRGEHGLSDDQIQLCYEHAVEDAAVDISAALSSPPRPQGKKEGSFQG